MLEWIDDLSRFIFLEDEPEKADIIFVPGNRYAQPAEFAAQLYRRGFAPFVLPSGRYAIGSGGFAGQLQLGQMYPGSFETEWAFMRHVLIQNGVEPSAILREDEATYTYQNAIFSRRRTDSEGLVIRRAIICCLPVHARRAKMYYQTLFPEAQLLVCPTSDAPVTKDTWRQSPEGIDAVLGEMERCGAQFHDILREILL